MQAINYIMACFFIAMWLWSYYFTCWHWSSGITDVGIAAIANGCPSLEQINIAYNTNVTDNSLLSLSKCLNLRRLEVRACPHISSMGLSDIAVRCRQLEILDIKRCFNINDAGMVQLAQHSQNLKQVISFSVSPLFIKGISSVFKDLVPSFK